MRLRAVLALLALLTGCGGGTEPSTVAGTYLLTQVNGQALPAGNSQQTFVWGALFLRGDLTFLRRDTVSVVVTGSVTQRLASESSGTWSRTGTTITLAKDLASGGGTLTATLDGNAVIVADGVTLRYVK